MRQHGQQIIHVHLAVFQTIVHTGKLPRKGCFFAQRYWRTDMTRNRQGIYQIEQGVSQGNRI
jgi:hypothetical protein